MVIHAEEQKKEVRQHMREGSGEVVVEKFAMQPMPANTRLFAVLSMEKGCSIGPHIHERESELFYVLSGEGVYLDGDTETALRKGDAAVCYDKGRHSIRNDREETLRVLACIVTE